MRSTWIRFDRPEDEAVFRAFDWRAWALELNASQSVTAAIQIHHILKKMMELGLPVRLKESAAPIKRREELVMVDGEIADIYPKDKTGKHPRTGKFKPDVRLGSFGKGCAGRILQDGESLCHETWIRFDRPEDEAVFRAFDWLSWANALNASQAGHAAITQQRVLAKMRNLGIRVRPKGVKTDPLF